MTPAEVVKFCQDQGIGIIDLKFTDLPGTLQHLSIPLSELTEENLADGYGFDGSSIRGFKAIQESDMLLMPDTSTAVVDPFLAINSDFRGSPVGGRPSGFALQDYRNGS